MRKNINKLVAFAIGISVISGTAIPAFAADTTTTTTATATTTQNTSASTVTSVQAQTTKPILTLDDAIKAAINNSDTLKLDDKKISYQDRTNDVNEKIDDASKTIDSDKKDLDSDVRDTTLKQLKQQRDFNEDKLIQKTTTAYNAIVTSQMKIAKAQREIDIKTKDLNNAKLKNQLGIITTIDVQTTELNIQNLQIQKKSQENALKDAQDNFKVLTGKDVTVYYLEQDIKYETFKINGSVDDYLDNIIESYLKYNEELIKLNKDYLDDNKFTEDDVKKAEDIKKEAESSSPPNIDLSTATLEQYNEYVNKLNSYNAKIQGYTGTLSERLTYLKSKLGSIESETNLNESKKKFKESLKNLYTNLLTTEDNINWLKKNIELTNTQLRNAKLKYDLGMITKSEYDNQVLNSENLEIQLRSAIDSYNTLKEQIQKPWLAF